MSDEHRRRYLAELDSANKAIVNAGALLTDDDGSWIDPEVMSEDFMSYYNGLVSAGYANGFI